MKPNKSKRTPNYGPLGPGHEPATDPMKGLRGVMAGTLILEFITFLLVIPVVMRVDQGAYNSPLRIIAVTIFSLALLVMAFMQKKSWAIPVDVALQIVAILGFFIHPSMGVMGIIFAGVWAYILYLRRNLLERMRRGLLPTQHL